MSKLVESLLGRPDNGNQLLLAASITDQTTDVVIQSAVQQGLAISELRVDMLAVEHDADRLQSLVTQQLQRIEQYGLKRLLTIRAGFEGGEWRGTESDRLQLIQAAIEQVDAVDIELAAHEIRDNVITLAKDHAVVSIVSHHDFSMTPDNATLQAVHDQAVTAGADIVKIACTANSAEDVQRLAKLLLDNAKTAMVVIAMGEWGAASRVFFPLLGSLFTFTHLGEASAPGQIGLEDMQAAKQAYYAQ